MGDGDDRGLGDRAIYEESRARTQRRIEQSLEESAFLDMLDVPDLITHAIKLQMRLDEALVVVGGTEEAARVAAQLLELMGRLAEKAETSPRDPEDGALLVWTMQAAFDEMLEKEVELDTWAPRTVPDGYQGEIIEDPRSIAEVPPFAPHNVASWKALLDAADRARERAKKPKGKDRSSARIPSQQAGFGDSAEESPSGGGGGNGGGGDSGRIIIQLPNAALEIFPGPPDKKILELTLVRTQQMTFRSDDGKRAILKAVIYHIANPITEEGAEKVASLAPDELLARMHAKESDDYFDRAFPVGSSFEFRFGKQHADIIETLLAGPDEHGERYGTLTDTVKSAFMLPFKVHDFSGPRPLFREVLPHATLDEKLAWAWTFLETNMRHYVPGEWARRPGTVGSDGLFLGYTYANVEFVLHPDMTIWSVDVRELQLEAFRVGVLQSAGGVALAWLMIETAAMFAMPGSGLGRGLLSLGTRPRAVLQAVIANPGVAAKSFALNLGVELSFSAATGEIRSFEDFKRKISDPTTLALLMLETAGELPGASGVVSDVMAAATPDMPTGAVAKAAPDVPPGALAHAVPDVPPGALSKVDTPTVPMKLDGPSVPMKLDEPSVPLKVDEPSVPMKLDEQPQPPKSSAIDDAQRAIDDKAIPGTDAPQASPVPRGRAQAKTGTPATVRPKRSKPRGKRKLKKGKRARDGIRPALPNTTGDALEFNLDVLDRAKERTVKGVKVTSVKDDVLIGGSDLARHREDFLSILESNPDHRARGMIEVDGNGKAHFREQPYNFKMKGGKRVKVRGGNKEAWARHPEDWESGHARTAAAGDMDVAVVMTRSQNQRISANLERKGEMRIDEIMVIDGVAFHPASAWELWEHGFIRATHDEMLAMPRIAL